MRAQEDKPAPARAINFLMLAWILGLPSVIFASMSPEVDELLSTVALNAHGKSFEAPDPTALRSNSMIIQESKLLNLESLNFSNLSMAIQNTVQKWPR